MTTRRLTITAPNNVDVRTAEGKRYVVVEYGTTTQVYHRDRPHNQRWETVAPYESARVAMRTDSSRSALRMTRDYTRAWAVYAVTRTSKFEAGHARRLDRAELEDRARSERETAKFARSVGNNGEARRLFY